MLRFVLFLSFALGLYQTAAAGVVRVADGDCAGFRSAVASASSSGAATTILLARKGTYSACTFDAEQGSIEIAAQGATFQFLIGKIAASASVTMRDATITSAADGANPVLICESVVEGFGGSLNGVPAICNDGGNLGFVNVTFRDFSRPGTVQGGYAGTIYAGLIYSTGNLLLRNVTVSNNQDSQLITSLEKAEIYNSTFSDDASYGGLSFENYNPVTGHAVAPGLLVSNSVFAKAGGSICRISNVPVTSLGGNVGTDASCGLSTDMGDKIAPDLTLPAASDHGGLVPTVQIGYGNPAYRFGVAKYCEATDAREVTRNATNCDAGAYESGGGLGLVTANGMNGLYYVPGISNGHYVSVQRIHDNNDVMVFWNTFDQNGKPAWIFGVGTLASDRHIHASMYRNLGGVLQPGGSPTGAKPSEWGTVDIDLTSCSAAQFAYQSSLPDFGSGQFPLTRLAFESAINCGD